MSRRTKIFQITTSLLTIAFLLLGGTLVTLQNAIADGDDTDEGGVSGGGCGDWWDTCYGASWRKYPIDYSRSNDASYNAATDVITIHNRVRRDGTVSVYGGSLTGCAGYGADEYYRLGLEAYRNTSPITKLGYQAGLVQTGSIYNKPGGSGQLNLINFKKLSDTESWEDVKASYDIAYSKGYVTEGWGGGYGEGVSAFCWNDDWRSESSEAGFASTSSVSGSDIGTVTTNPDEDNRMVEVFVTEETYTATFWHNIKFTTGFADIPTTATIPTISTNWTVGSYSITPTTATTSTTGTLPASNTFTVSNPRADATSSNLSQNTITITVPSRETVKVCQGITYSPKSVTLTSTPSGGYEAETSGNDGSSICISVTNTSTPPEPTSSDGFWAESQIEIPAQNDVPGYTSDWVSSKDGATHRASTIKLSTDAATLTVNFKQKMYYGNKLWLWSVQPAGSTNHPIGSSDTFPDICSTFSATWSGSESGSAASGSHCTAKAGTNSGKQVSSTSKTISLNKGETKTLCQSFQHDAKTVTLSREHDDTAYSCNCSTCGTPPNTYSCGCSTCYRHNKYDYSESSRSGSGTTDLCVEVTRPLDPDIPGDGKIPEDTQGPVTVSTERMYAGQTANIGWSARAKSVAARRLKQFQAISYLVDVSKSYSADNHKGNISANSNNSDSTYRYPNRQNTDPCSFYQAKSASWVWCETAGSGGDFAGTLSYGSTETTHWSRDIHRTVTVPDYVGYKYCNSFGYKWEYWYSIGYDGSDSWQHESSKDYWTNYGSVCRTIAKKPNSAIWNGGIMTVGGIQTSLAERYANAGWGKPSEDASRGAKKLFGTWTEHLAVIGGGVNGFASGATLSRGNDDSDIYEYSSMTISNTEASSLGSSGIGATTTLRDRLKTYLREQPASSRLEHTNTSSLAGLTVADSKTRIYASTGSFTISGDIKISDTYNSIYEIPQVLIFVDGDVTIAPGVQRVDAWIIATGKVETCAARPTDNTIATTANGYTGGTTTCDKQLVVNGPVIAGSTSLNRSYGADPIVYGTASERYTAAEIFNLSAEAYLWAYAQAGRYGSSYTEAYSRELAPRY